MEVTKDQLEYLWLLWFLKQIECKSSLYVWHHLDSKEYINFAKEPTNVTIEDAELALRYVWLNKNIHSPMIEASNILTLLSNKFSRTSYDFALRYFENQIRKTPIN